MSSPKRDEGGCEADDDDTCSSASSTTFEGLDDSSVKTAAPSSGVSPQTPSASSQTLEPFAHQVGGHFPMVCLDDQTLCKPMSEREHLIYTTMPDVLRPFVPAFHGVMKVHVREKEDGYIELIGHPPPQFRRSQATKPYQKRLSLYKSNSFVDAEPRESFCNPWALKVHSDHLAKLGTVMASLDARQTYLLLENVVCNYTHPCVLDLKVGKRQYSDDCSETKVARKIARANQTTTASLGLRLTGMQVHLNGDYECLNKYDGRGLTDATFKSTLDKFLQGDKVALIRSLTDKLGRLRSVLQTLDSFRFHTCSLLVAYDASAPQEADVRLIDFAHSTHSGVGSAAVPAYQGPDTDFIEGLSSLMTILEDIMKEATG